MKHEELVEEIADYLQACYTMGQHDYKLGIGYGETPRKWDRDRAKKIITLILSAFRDGLSFELIEEIAALEHEQWMEWSKRVAGEVSPERRARWEAYWIPYEQLSEEVKEHDRVWARKIIALRPLTGTGKDGPESARVHHPDTAKET